MAGVLCSMRSLTGRHVLRVGAACLGLPACSCCTPVGLLCRLTLASLPVTSLPILSGYCCRVGLLPLRKRSREHYLLINGGSLKDAATMGTGMGLSASDSCPEEGSVEPQPKKQRGGQQGAPAAAVEEQHGVAGNAAVNGKGARGAAGSRPSAAAATAAAAAGGLLSKLAAGLPAAASAALSRKGGAAAGGAGEAAATAKAAPAAASGAPAKRASQRLGGLSGPVGSALLGSFSRRGSAN